jgi:hypothetical protein
MLREEKLSPEVSKFTVHICYNDVTKWPLRLFYIHKGKLFKAQCCSFESMFRVKV